MNKGTVMRAKTIGRKQLKAGTVARTRCIRLTPNAEDKLQTYRSLLEQHQGGEKVSLSVALNELLQSLKV